MYHPIQVTDARTSFWYFYSRFCIIKKIIIWVSPTWMDYLISIIAAVRHNGGERDNNHATKDAWNFNAYCTCQHKIMRKDWLILAF